MPRIGLGLALGGVLLWRGLVPAVREGPGDFVNYWLPARVFVEGGDVGALRDDRVFAAELTRRGIAPVGRASQFPPPAMLVAAPLAFADVRVAFGCWLAVKLALLPFVAWLGASIARVRPADALLVLLGTGAALGNDFRFGQFYLPLLAGVLACVPLTTGWAGAGLALLASWKLFPAIWIPFAVRERAGALGVLVGLAAALGLGLLAVGPAGMLGWFTGVLGPHLDGDLGPQGAWSWSFQSWNVLLRRMFLLDPVENPDPPVPWALGYSLARGGLFALGAAWLARVWGWTAHRDADSATRLRAGAVGAVALALAPATATYHLLLGLAPLAWIWPVGSQRARVALAGCVLAVGWIPYGVFFRAGEVFLPLGFPRLALLSAAALAAGLAARPDQRIPSGPTTAASRS